MFKRPVSALDIYIIGAAAFGYSLKFAGGVCLGMIIVEMFRYLLSIEVTVKR